MFHLSRCHGAVHSCSAPLLRFKTSVSVALSVHYHDIQLYFLLKGFLSSVTFISHLLLCNPITKVGWLCYRLCIFDSIAIVCGV